uniref:PDEase domain-containing protein n=2 Tax=Photinus pyralis TaxID=7054 RepID=A0A1Y1MET1_PHOPY
MVAPVEVPVSQRRFSAEDWVLLDAMGSIPLPTCTGRFLTMHKRRRKKLTTRSLNQDHAILDDIFHGQVQHILNTCGLWGFNAFTLETVTGGRSLPVLCVHLFHWYGLLDHFQLDVVRVWKLFSLIEEGYHSTNPYHNSIHATDVTQAMHCFLQEQKIKEHLQPLEVMAALIGAVAHDLDHPGVNQHFLISTSNHLAILYDNMSVLENHHWRSAVGCLLESGVAQQLTPCRNELENQIRSLILATDINRQQEFLIKFKVLSRM